MQKDKITRTQKDIENIKNFIKKHGFKSIAAFGKAVNMERQNVQARINGKTDPSIRVLLEWAKVLNCEITELIKLFYSKEYIEYEASKQYISKQYPTYIMENIRQNLGLEPDDNSQDDRISNMDKEEIIERYLVWEGICGYGSTILELIKDVMSID